MDTTKEFLSRLIDYSVLQADLSREDIKSACEQAQEYNLHSIFVLPVYVPYCVKLLKDTGVKVGTVVSFPYGCDLPEVKAHQTELAISCGADEIDMVISLPSLKSKDYILVSEEIKEVVRVAKGKIVKVIIETCYLTDEEKIKASQIVEEAGADFIKTSTGVGKSGATVEDIELIKKAISKKMQIKASGGIRTLSDAVKFIKAGAHRIGTSSAIDIIKSMK